MIDNRDCWWIRFDPIACAGTMVTVVWMSSSSSPSVDVYCDCKFWVFLPFVVIAVVAAVVATIVVAAVVASLQRHSSNTMEARVSSAVLSLLQNSFQ